MATIMVVASVNMDRIWWLDRPLVPGSRISCQRQELRRGGGGFNTGTALLDLGHEVILVTTLSDDDDGRAYLEALGGLGFNTDFVRLVPGETAPAEILVEPNGERTIIGRSARRKPPLEALPPIDAALVYLNVKSMQPAAIEELARFPLVVLQYPLSGERRPADVLIASGSDVMGSPQAVWAHALDKAGQRLGTLVLTNGRDPVAITDRKGRILVPVPQIGPVRDTTGAGDYFAAGYIDALLGGLGAGAAALSGCSVSAARLTRGHETQTELPG